MPTWKENREGEYKALGSIRVSPAQVNSSFGSRDNDDSPITEITIQSTSLHARDPPLRLFCDQFERDSFLKLDENRG